MTQLHPDICVTMLATEAFFERIQKEAARSFDEGQEECASRLRPVILLQPHIVGSQMIYVYRIVSLGAFGMFKTAKDDARFEEMWKTLLAGEGPVSGRQGQSWGCRVELHRGKCAGCQREGRATFHLGIERDAGSLTGVFCNSVAL